MSENPYAAPASEGRPSEVAGVNSGRREDVRSVAVYQKGILVCILIQIVTFAAQFVLPEDLAIAIAWAVIFVGVSLTSTVLVFLLAMKVYNVAMGIILGIGALLPVIGLVVLLMVNGRASRILQENGHRVGLLGADLSKF